MSFLRVLPSSIYALCSRSSDIGISELVGLQTCGYGRNPGCYGSVCYQYLRAKHSNTNLHLRIPWGYVSTPQNTLHFNFLITARVRSSTGGYVFTGVCLFGRGGGCP